MRITPAAIKPLAQAAGRHRQARAEAESGSAQPHQTFLTRYRGLEAMINANRDKILKELSMLQGYDAVRDWEVLGHLVAALPPAMLKRIYGLVEIRELSVLFGKRPLPRLLANNQALKAEGVVEPVQYRQERFAFSARHNNYKSALALVLPVRDSDVVRSEGEKTGKFCGRRRSIAAGKRDFGLRDRVHRSAPSVVCG